MAICIGISLIISVGAATFDLYERWHDWLQTHEDWELDEVLSALALSSVTFAWYSYRRWRESLREVERSAAINRELSTEIAERTKSEISLRHSEERLRQASQIAKIGHYVWDAVEDRCLFCSEMHAQVHGLTPAEYMAQASDLAGTFVLTHADDRDAVHRAMERLRDGQPIEIEYRTVAPNGDVRHVREIAEPIFDDTGRVVREIGTTQDITAAKRTESLLFRAMDASAAVFALFDSDDRLIVANRNYRNMYESRAAPIVPGVAFESLVRAFAAEVGIGDSAADSEAWVAARLNRRNKPAQGYEFKSGDGHWMEVSDFVMEDGCVFTVGLIVTERKQLAETLRAREAYLSAFFAHSSNEISIKDTEGRYILFNPEAQRRFGLTAEQVIGKTSHEIYPKDTADQIEAQDRRTVKTGRPNRKEIAADTDKGRRIFSALKFPIYDATGKFLGLGTITTDITDLKTAEQQLRESEVRFRGLVENTPLSVVLKNPDGRFVLVNPVFEARYGVTSAEVAGKTDYDLHSKETAELYAQHDKEVLERGEAISREIEAVFNDGSRHTVVVTKFPIRDARGEFSGIGSVSVDITDRQKAEDQLRQAQKMEALGRLTGGVAHDFNNMLTAIIANLEILDTLVDGNAGAKRSLDIAFRAASNAAGLVRSMLSFSRQRRLETKNFDLRAAVLGMSDLLRTTMGPMIQLDLYLDEDLRDIHADQAQLESAIVNLAVNARHAMPDGGTLTIEATGAEFSDSDSNRNTGIAPGSYVVLIVNDSGTGMPQAVKERAFEPFFTTKDVGEGTGLGLSTVFGLLKQLGGHVTLASQEGRGTSVRLYLPVSKAEETESSTGAMPRRHDSRHSDSFAHREVADPR